MPKKRTLIDAGYDACMKGLPCEAPVTRELDRGAWEQGWRDAKRGLDYEFSQGRKTALAEYLKACRTHPPNPYKDPKTQAWKYWNRGWLAGCDEVLAALRKSGNCIDV